MGRKFIAKGGELGEGEREERREQERKRQRNREMETETDRDTERPATSEKLLHRKKRAGIGGVLPAMCASARFPRGRAGLRLPR